MGVVSAAVQLRAVESTRMQAETKPTQTGVRLVWANSYLLCIATGVHSKTPGCSWWGAKLEDSILTLEGLEGRDKEEKTWLWISCPFSFLIPSLWAKGRIEMTCRRKRRIELIAWTSLSDSPSILRFSIDSGGPMKGFGSSASGSSAKRRAEAWRLFLLTSWVRLSPQMFNGHCARCHVWHFHCVGAASQLNKLLILYTSNSMRLSNQRTTFVTNVPT